MAECSHMSTNKTDEIKVRVSPAMKAAIVKLATHRGEGESVIVREAINRYLNEVQPLRETPPAYGTPTKPADTPVQAEPPSPKKARGLPGFAAALSIAAVLLIAGCSK